MQRYEDKNTLKIDSDKISRAIKKEFCEGSLTEDSNYIYFRSPLLDFSNDEIVLKISMERENEITISDNNRTIMNLLSTGFDPYSSKTREFLMDSLLGSCGVEIKKYGEVFAIAKDFEEIGEKIFWMVHAVQRLTAAAMMGRAYKPQTFKKEVIAFMREEKIEFREDPLYRIGNKIKARIDIDAVKLHEAIICRAMSYSSVAEAITYSEKFVHESEIIKKGSKYEIIPIAIIDDSTKTYEDEPVFNEDVINLLSSTRVVPWSEKEVLVEVFKT